METLTIIWLPLLCLPGDLALISLKYICSNREMLQTKRYISTLLSCKQLKSHLNRTAEIIFQLTFLKEKQKQAVS